MGEHAGDIKMSRCRLKRLRKIMNLYLHQKAVVKVLQEYLATVIEEQDSASGSSQILRLFMAVANSNETMNSVIFSGLKT